MFNVSCLIFNLPSCSAQLAKLCLVTWEVVSFDWRCKGTTFPLRFTNTSQEIFIFFLALATFCHFVPFAVIWSFVIWSKSKRDVKIHHYYNKYIYLFNSEQKTCFRNRKWPNDLDHFDHVQCLFLILVDSLLLFSWCSWQGKTPWSRKAT